MTSKKQNEDLCVYCGCKKKPPPGSRFGTPEECIERKQIRLYGVKKIDPKLLESGLSEKQKMKKKLQKLKLNVASLKGKLHRLNINLKQVDPKGKEYKDIKKELEENNNKLKNYYEEMKDLDELINPKKKESPKKESPKKEQPKNDKKKRDMIKKLESKNDDIVNKIYEYKPAINDAYHESRKNKPNKEIVKKGNVAKNNTEKLNKKYSHNLGLIRKLKEELEEY